MGKIIDKTKWKPNRKVARGGLAGAVATILIAVLASFGVTVTPELAAALTTVLASLTAYIVKEPQQ